MNNLIAWDAASSLDIGPGKVTNDLSARVRVNGKLGVLIAETPTGDDKQMIVVQFDGETRPKTYTVPPAIMERLALLRGENDDSQSAPSKGKA